MYTIMFTAQFLIFAVLLFSIGVIVGQWANLPITEWDKLEDLPTGKALRKVMRCTYWSIRKFFRKLNRTYPFDD